MDLDQFQYCSDIMPLTGNVLNIEKRSLLQSSLTLLQNDNHFDKVYFWGKINGLDCDYYVAFGYKKDLIRGTVFYYSKNALDWVLLPKSREMDNQLSLLISSRFQGDPRLQVDVVDDKPEDRDSLINIGAGDASKLRLDLFKKMPTYVLKEEDRLAAIVLSATEEGAAIPRGALYKHPNGMVVPNGAFYGLKVDEALNLSNYCHFRKPRDQWDSNLLKRPDYNYSLDFLDTIDSDVPINCCWSSQLVNYNRTVILRSLYWPGMTSYHHIESNVYGFLFFGLGKKNLDIPFMIN